MCFFHYYFVIFQEDPYARLNRSLAYPPYPMFDYHGYMGPPETFRRDDGGTALLFCYHKVYVHLLGYYCICVIDITIGPTQVDENAR